MKFRIALAAASALALAACGSSDDASTEAEADTVEIGADDTLTDVTEEPVADPAATATPESTEPTVTEQQQIDEASENAANNAEAAADLLVEE